MKNRTERISGKNNEKKRKNFCQKQIDGFSSTRFLFCLLFSVFDVKLISFRFLKTTKFRIHLVRTLESHCLNNCRWRNIGMQPGLLNCRRKRMKRDGYGVCGCVSGSFSSQCVGNKSYKNYSLPPPLLTLSSSSCGRSMLWWAYMSRLMCLCLCVRSSARPNVRMVLCTGHRTRVEWVKPIETVIKVEYIKCWEYFVVFHYFILSAGPRSFRLW